MAEELQGLMAKFLTGAQTYLSFTLRKWGKRRAFLLRMINSHFHSLIRSETNIPFRMSFFVFSGLLPKLTMRQKSLGTSAIMRITDQQQCVRRAPCELILAGQCPGEVAILVSSPGETEEGTGSSTSPNPQLCLSSHHAFC